MAAEDRMQRLRTTGRDIVNLGAGQLDFDTPAPIAQAGVEAIARGCTHYTPVAGTIDLRRAVRTKFERENGLRFVDDRCLRISFATSLDESTAALGRLWRALA
jgi:aspartate/methionine/tyrosine aminotransferase